MSDKSSIEWTEATWNPVRGCTKVSPGCKHCYAETFAERFRGVPGHPYEQGFDLRLVPEALSIPIHWRAPRRVFVNSMSDLFHEAVSFEYIDQVFGVMAACECTVCDGGPGHTFQVLTKRPERMRHYLSTDRRRFWAREAVRFGGGENPDPLYDQVDSGPEVLPHVWLGVSVESQAAADERIPHLLATPAAVRFLSCEPLLGPVDLQPTIDAWARDVASGSAAPGRIGWVIVGGESGAGARPCDVAWIRSIVEQCRAAGLPAFVKQLGAHSVMAEAAWHELAAHGPAPIIRPGARDGFVRLSLEDPKGGDMRWWPRDLRVRQMPEAPCP